MPYLHIRVSEIKSQELSAKIVKILMDLTTAILHKDKNLTAITIEYVDPQDWYIAGKSLQELNKKSFFLDIKITDETNTKSEKADYIREIFKEMESLLGSLHDESYVHVHDARSAAYGYGGLTQEYRYQHAHSK